MKTELLAWDIEDTLIPKAERKSPNGNRVIRSNALELLAGPPVLSLTPGVSETLKIANLTHLPQGVISSFAYQFGINLIAASDARNFIDPRLIFLGHKFAWEGMMLEDKNYDSVLKEHLKPSTRMFELLLEKANRLQRRTIAPKNCVYVGDNEKDRDTSEKAGWQYYDVKDIRDLREKLEDERKRAL